MSENEIKPVAWVDLDVWISTNDAGDSFFTDYQDEDTVAVYDQSAIDRLTAELNLVSGERNRVQLKWDEFRQTKNAEAQRLTAERDDWRIQAWHETDVAAVAVQEVERLKEERDAAVADAERYRWLAVDRAESAIPRVWSSDAEALPVRCLHGAEIDAAIDAARSEDE